MKIFLHTNVAKQAGYLARGDKLLASKLQKNSHMHNLQNTTPAINNCPPHRVHLHPPSSQPAPSPPERRSLGGGRYNRAAPLGLGSNSLAYRYDNVFVRSGVKMGTTWLSRVLVLLLYDKRKRDKRDNNGCADNDSG
jgi:hypothetical protein